MFRASLCPSSGEQDCVLPHIMFCTGCAGCDCVELGPASHNHGQHNQCRTPYAVVHSLVLLMMGIMMPETCWDRSLIINIRLFASCWFLSLCLSLSVCLSLSLYLHPTFMMHGHKHLKLSTNNSLMHSKPNTLNNNVQFFFFFSFYSVVSVSSSTWPLLVF